eukprot:scaffold282834_cov24-Prasinocladus_malaysianus.AAC.1
MIIALPFFDALKPLISGCERTTQQPEARHAIRAIRTYSYQYSTRVGGQNLYEYEYEYFYARDRAAREQNDDYPTIYQQRFLTYGCYAYRYASGKLIPRLPVP